MWGRYFIAIAVVLGALVSVVGCGDDGGDGGEGNAATAANGRPASGVTKSEYIDQANSLCAKRTAELAIKSKRAFKKVFSKPEKVAAKQLAKEAVIPVFEGELRDLKTLSIPSEGEQQVAAIYEAIEDFIAELKADPTAQEFYPYTKAEKLAKQYGISACAHP